MRRDQVLNRCTALLSSSRPHSPRTTPAAKKPRMTRLPPKPVHADSFLSPPAFMPSDVTPFPSSFTPFPSSFAPAFTASSLRPINTHSSQASRQLPATPPRLSRAESMPIEGRAAMTSLSLPASQPRNRRRSQVITMTGFPIFRIFKRRPRTIPATMNSTTASIFISSV